jgi:hypothetical protein
MLGVFESSAMDVSRLKGMDSDFWKTGEYERLNITVRFIRDLVDLMDKCKVPYRGVWKTKRKTFDGVYNQVANIIFEVIHHAAYVTEPDWTCWSVQHNAVWSDLFTHAHNKAWRIIRFKVRRLIYDEIRRMDEWPNFKGARLLGLCLNVLGFKGKRTRDIFKESTVLMPPVAAWAKRNYLRLVKDNPQVANACLHGNVTFEPDQKELVKTYPNELSNKPSKDVLQLE